MIKNHLPLVSTLSLFLIACGAGSPLEQPASVPTTPSTAAATGVVTAPGTSNPDSGDAVNGDTDSPDASDSDGDTGSSDAGVSGGHTGTSDAGDSGVTTPSEPVTSGAGSDPATATVTLPVACSASDDDIRVRMLELINSARAEARNCGSTPYAATAPLAWNTQLVTAAKVHSQDMAQHNFFDHTGSDGSSVADRATAAGFIWQTIGENIAAGQPSAKSAVDGWLDSPGHCRNLMNPNFTQVSVACVEDSGSDYGR